jgi:outer membrane protein assembly factor BamB
MSLNREDSMDTVAASPRPIRVWPIGALAAFYWIFTLIVAQSDMAMFVRFMSGALSALAFLVVFLILWSSNGTVPGRTRLLGVGLLFGGAALGIVLAHSTYEPVGFLMASVPYVLTGVVAWHLFARRWTPAQARAALVALILLGFGTFDLIRWDGLDGRLRSSASWRWSTTSEQAFLAAKRAAAAESTPSKSWSLRSDDCPEFRGSRRDGVVRGQRLEGLGKDAPLPLAWKTLVGPAWSGVIAVDGRLVTQEQRGNAESVVCYDAETGKELWNHGDETRFEEGIAGPGPRATPTFHDGRLYSLGGRGLVTCLDAATGKSIWSRDLGKEGASPPPQWGNSASPLVVDGKVLVFVGGTGAKGVMALDAATGVPAWSKLGGKESYSSVQLLFVRGKPQLLAQDNQGLTGLAVADGAVLWQRPNPDPAVIPMLQAAPVDDHRFVVAFGAGIALLDLQEEGGIWKASETWSTQKFRPSFSNFVVHEGHVYGLDDGILACVDVRDGSRVWKKGRYGSGQVLLLAEPSLLVVLSEKGELALVDARPQEPGEVVRFPAIAGKTWAHPTVAQGRLIVRNAAEMACFRLTPTK